MKHYLKTIKWELIKENRAIDTKGGNTKITKIEIECLYSVRTNEQSNS